ncbi:YihY/virulence factor BrkB family protein [Synechococcus sp. CCY 0621]|uniref:YihY/virulence factor BrkB family protein n=1 Tax=Synechococcus sp. CCY 0621 TaxID=2815603 RepID=UPI001C22BEAB|nr:YihY/virulence factor BrkB family protein [Synechococcus sp. CCY 0621]
MRLRRSRRLIRETIAEWKQDNVPLHAAALAYYTIFSLAPLLLIAIAVAGAVFGEEAARGELVRQIQGLVGKEGAVAIQAMIENASRPGTGGVLASVVGFLLLLLGASGVFGQLQMALNTIWNVEPKPGRGWRDFLISRFLSFAMVLVIGFLLLVSLLRSSLLVAAGDALNRRMPGLPILGQALNLMISLGVITVLFASIYKYLPDVRVPWRDLWVGAAATSVLFNLGKTAIGLYIGNSSFDSTYGAAGSLVVLLIWIFYSTQILLIGAEFTQVYSRSQVKLRQPSQQSVVDGAVVDREFRS